MALCSSCSVALACAQRVPVPSSRDHTHFAATARSTIGLWLVRGAANLSSSLVRIGVGTWEAGTTTGAVTDGCDEGDSFGPRERFVQLDKDETRGISREELTMLGAEMESGGPVPPSPYGRARPGVQPAWHARGSCCP